MVTDKTQTQRAKLDGKAGDILPGRKPSKAFLAALQAVSQMKGGKTSKKK